MKHFASLAGIGCLVLGGCGMESSYSPLPASPGGTYTYEFSDPAVGCTTGKHVYYSLGNLCLGLQDEGSNHRCGLEERQRYFEARGCAGRFG